MDQFSIVEFRQFKAFKRFTLKLRTFNILVGPNNSGKSTILAAFRILAAAMRRASARKATVVTGPEGPRLGYEVDLGALSVAGENIFFNYDDSEAAYVTFHLSNGNNLQLYFGEQGSCVLLPDAQGAPTSTPKDFRKHFDCPIGFVPILGPVEHDEPLYSQEAARLALFNYRAARNFRNIWYHYPDKFDEFRTSLLGTWPGMDIQRPEVVTGNPPRLYMYCPEERIPRELFWSGFGFQVWCQMLTHIIQSKDVSIFLIDEPDIYLHSELQRQLLGILRDLGPDVLIATHSTEIITEAETDDILVISKNKSTSRRIKNPSQLESLFQLLGSNLNPVLTQLAKTRRVVFVEGKDFQIISKFARKLNYTGISNRRDFAVVPVKGFSPDRIQSLKDGMEATLGGKITALIILDRDYRCDDEIDLLISSCKKTCGDAIIHKRKEIENFLLVPDSIDRAAKNRISEKSRREGSYFSFEPMAERFLDDYSASRRNYVSAQLLAERRRFRRATDPSLHDSTNNEAALDEFDRRWATKEQRLRSIPGKEAFSSINDVLQSMYSINVTATAVIDAMRNSEIPCDMVELIEILDDFSRSR